MKQILKTLVETMTLPEDSYLEQDAEILEIFIEELDEIFVELEPLLVQWREQPHQQDVLTDVRRHFHTLKGSGRMVGAKSSGELAWTVEDTLNRVISGTVSLNTEIQRYVQAVFNIYRFKLSHDFKAVQKHLIDLKPLVLLGQQLQQQQSPEPALYELLNLANTLTHDDVQTGLELIDGVEDAINDKIVADQVQQDIETEQDEVLAKETLAIFLEESEDHLTAIDQFLLNERPNNDHYNTLIRALHTLRGSSSMAHVDQVFEASSKVENLFKTLLQDELDSSSDETALLTHYAQFVRDYLHTLRQQGAKQKLDEIYDTFNVAWDSYDFQLEEKHGEAIRPQGLVSELLELNINDLLDVEFDFEKRARNEFPQYIQLLSHQAEILLQHTHHHATIGMYQYTSLLRSSYQDLIFKPSLLNLDYAFELYHQVHQQFIQLFDTLAAGQRVTLTKAHERVLNELSSFTQQNIDFLEQTSTDVMDAVPETVAPEQAQDSASVLDITDLSAQFALDKQQLHSDEANRDFDPDLLDIFLEEADELLVGIDTDLNTWAADHKNVAALKNLMRYLHTLKGGSNMIQARHIGLIAHELETIYEKLINQQIQATPQLITVIRSVQDDIADRIQTIRDQQVDYPSAHVLQVLANLGQMAGTFEAKPVAVEQLEETDEEVDSVGEETAVSKLPVQIESPHTAVDVTALAAQLGLDKQQLQSAESNSDFDPDLLDIFLEEADELLVGIDADLSTWAADHQDVGALKNLMRYLHTLKGGSNMIQARHIGLIAHELETIYEKLINQQIQATPQLIALIRLVQDDIADRIQTIRDQQIDYPSTHVVQLLQQADHSADLVVSEPATEITALSEQDESSELEVLQLVEEAEVSEQPSLAADELSGNDTEEQVEDTSSLQTVENAEHSLEDDVRSLVEQTFLEEAEELLEQAQGLLKQWFDQRGNRSLLLQLQRNAHSLKGGARMAEMDAIAIIAYHLENAFEQFGVHHFSSNVYDNLLNTALAWLNDAIFKRQYANFDGLKQSLEKMEFVDVAAQLPQKLSATDIFTPEYTMEFIQGDGTEPPSMLGEWETTERIEQNNEMIRVSADVIEKMIDLSGENAINRSRIEMDLGQLGGTLTEMELAIKRLADQLRRMEGELESQIIARHGGENSRYADFDPLEMDQYSSLNQLSKSLAESASDLVDFKTTLSEKIRDTEGLLLQQSRIQAEIQESLMRTRLVPFSRLLPRLQRIVRQTASTLNRPTELVVNNTEGELDRSILERLVAPFEHMLRNAIDHGIEDREQRLQVKKPETGHIVLDIGRQGTDIVVTFSDDGKGIDVNRIKDKAIQTGLMTTDQKLDQEEVLQFIFHPGFSTAAQVTQISGRGVGLDVVQSDIKALGGHVSVSSILGKGTTFTIRVPTTVAVSDALMVKAGDQQFAFPLAQIDRIVRISPMALEQYFDSQEDYFKIDQERYRLRYLSEFVAGQPIPRLNGVVHSLPVLLIKGAQGQTTALLVDQLIGSRGQIVVKPIGQQFSSIGVIAGATILGDGQVCLILDGQNIARQAQSTARSKQADETYTKQRYDERRLIMIVDDSVTVRKVTSRLLERQGYDVVTAKDGVDAIEQLETVKPDLMLLDIEMPRMDGFEVTNLVRHHEIHRDLPIIMITSRTGEKHRERALSLGVNQYMGKPFQEETLLENIESLLTVR
ncbi:MULTISPECIES: Hpt domain-containing protein [unclassified Acinetobacter]|uniref:Hpt domain-containing protein n=1 Tax=unclassified Acinetobacter TaxID=196816 RepID=UPI00244CB308|nr:MULTISPECIES: Hpt domain-containing protein [unclassified Acinetobacter]MDH0030603.1 Hpt domain-containing protein [Acinetobacter sp. GD04021]MDH0886286.1 Hpt domain-containing protein [Acinetobacter sp. GD03873]MDH1081739.1 Hpt domain-containing protein [Acinetobacter sp. GD03983]MDH2189763.1 Hpt domain-containing protein [Acinetobacter sp. GD03645]MDH2202755.1 Hpt domain-containing protein [Acinetobacter sp. GD03647]